MKYADSLKILFPDLVLTPEDLLLLEPFQIEYLPNRAPRRELAALLKANPVVRRYLESICPSVKPFIDEVMSSSVRSFKPVEESCDDCLWEIADLIVYCKCPELYDATVDLPWSQNEIIDSRDLIDKTVIDAGAGPGKIAFLLASNAATVYAVEPVAAFRRFIRKKAGFEGIGNLFVVDGFLNSMPFPDSSVDILVTSDAIGWDLGGELREIERILKPHGSAIHLFRNVDFEDDSARVVHDVLVSPQWNYTTDTYNGAAGCKARYQKVMT